MQALARLWNQIRDIFGFRKNSKYVSNHLNEANIRTSIYMCAVVFVIEVCTIASSSSGSGYISYAPVRRRYTGCVKVFSFSDR